MESTTGFNLPSSKNCSTSCSSANPPMYDPNSENCRVKTYRISTSAFPPLVTPQFTNRPPGAKHRILRSQLQRLLLLLLLTNRRDHSRCAQQLRHLDRGHSNPTTCSPDQHILTRLQSRPSTEHMPRRQEDKWDRCRLFKTQFIWNRQ